MSNFVAYTKNGDGSVNVLAGSSNPAVFEKILPTGTQYEVHEGETYSAGGKMYLYYADPAYIAGKAQEEKAKVRSQLDLQYDEDKARLSQYYAEAALAGDSGLQAELKTEFEALNAEYDEKLSELKKEG